MSRLRPIGPASICLVLNYGVQTAFGLPKNYAIGHAKAQALNLMEMPDSLHTYVHTSATLYDGVSLYCCPETFEIATYIHFHDAESLNSAKSLELQYVEWV